MELNPKFKLVMPLVGLALGIWLVVLGVQMARASFVTQEQQSVPGTKGRNAAIAATGGAVVGGGAAAAVGGGIGIAAMGTGVGIPFGILILIGVGLGAGAGGLAGAASGKSASTMVIVSDPAPLYSPWAWGAILVAGILLLIYSVSYMRKLHESYSLSNNSANIH